MSAVGIASYASSPAKERSVSIGELLFRHRKRLILELETREVHLKLLWLQPHLEGCGGLICFWGCGLNINVKRSI